MGGGRCSYIEYDRMWSLLLFIDGIEMSKWNGRNDIEIDMISFCLIDESHVGGDILWSFWGGRRRNKWGGPT